MSTQTPFFIVTGAGRSGTSAVARVLHESGVSMGRSMAEPSEANPEGFYEDLDVVQLNEQILTDIGMNDPWRSERWPSRRTVAEAGARHREDMVRLARSGVSGWKDPRFSITLESWLPALFEKPRIIVCLRSPQEYADSSTRIYGLVTTGRAKREWARHYRRLLAIIRRHDLPATCVEFDELIEEPANAVDRLSRFVDYPLNSVYVEPRLRREIAPIPERYRELYDQVAALGGGSRYQPAKGDGRLKVAPAQKARPTTPNYDAVFLALAARVRQARDTWTMSVQMPRPTPDSVTATRTYAATLEEGQTQCALLSPPPSRKQQHARLARAINLERLITELTLGALTTGDSRTYAAAQRAWERFGGKPI